MSINNCFKQVHPKTAQLQAEKFFKGKICVATGLKDRRQCAWHHLDENSENNPLNGNLVPIIGGLNQAIDDHRKNSNYSLPYKLFDESLTLTSKSHWDNGDYALCYGANRLGAFLSLNHMNAPDNSITFCIEAMHALRPLWCQSLLLDTVRRSIWPIFKNITLLKRVAPLSVANLCKEVASWFLGIQDQLNFIKWKYLGDSLTSYITYHFDPKELTLSRLLQHEGFIYLQKKDFKKSYEKIKRADQIMREYQYHHGVTNNYQYIIRINLNSDYLSKNKLLCNSIGSLKEYEQSFGKLLPMDEWTQGQTPCGLWTLSGLMILKSEISFRRANINRSMEFLKSAQTLYRNKRIKNVELFRDSQAIKYFLDHYPLDGEILSIYVSAPVLEPIIKLWFSKLYKTIQQYENEILTDITM